MLSEPCIQEHANKVPCLLEALRWGPPSGSQAYVKKDNAEAFSIDGAVFLFIQVSTTAIGMDDFGASKKAKLELLKHIKMVQELGITVV